MQCSACHNASRTSDDVTAGFSLLPPSPTTEDDARGDEETQDRHQRDERARARVVVVVDGETFGQDVAHDGERSVVRLDEVASRRVGRP